jgi:hypothetical protein
MKSFVNGSFVKKTNSVFLIFFKLIQKKAA